MIFNKFVTLAAVVAAAASVGFASPVAAVTPDAAVCICCLCLPDRCVADYHFSERDNMNGESVLQAYWYGESAQAQMTGLARRYFVYTFPRTIGRSESWGKTCVE